MPRLDEIYTPVVVRLTPAERAARKHTRRVKQTRVVQRTLHSVLEEWDVAVTMAQSPVEQARIDAAYRKACRNLSRRSRY